VVAAGVRESRHVGQSRRSSSFRPGPRQCGASSVIYQPSGVSKSWASGLRSVSYRPSSVQFASVRASERSIINHGKNSIMPALSSKSGLSERGVDCVCASRGHSCLSAPGRLVSVVFTGLGVRTQSATRFGRCERPLTVNRCSTCVSHNVSGIVLPRPFPSVRALCSQCLRMAGNARPGTCLLFVRCSYVRSHYWLVIRLSLVSSPWSAV
jgi:hypothetical protein